MTHENKIDAIIQDCDDECENANYHDRVGLARMIWSEIAPLIPKCFQIKCISKITNQLKP